MPNTSRKCYKNNTHERSRRIRPHGLSTSAATTSSVAFVLLLVLAAVQSGSGIEDDAAISAQRTRGQVRRRSLQSEGHPSRHSDRDRSRHDRRRNARQPQQSSTCHHARKWHSSLTTPQECTNDNDIPSSWEWPPMRDKFLFDSWFACCEGMFMGPVACTHRDVCGDETLNDGALGDGHGVSGCEGRSWHPDNTASLPTCTNTRHGYPPYWENPEMKGVFMFDTPDECCNKLSPNGDCVMKEARECADDDGPDDCAGPWHPAADFDGCSNSPRGTYPDDWTVPGVSERYFYETHAECCNATFVYPSIDECPKTNHCPTGRPTPAPVSCPSENKWHRDADANARTCTNDLNYPKAWNDPFLMWDYLFDTPEQCCARTANQEEPCIVVDICTGPGEALELPATPITMSQPELLKATSADEPATHQPPVSCRGVTKKKQCSKKQECTWDATIDSCADAALSSLSAEVGPGENSQLQYPTLVEEQAMTEPTTRCGGIEKKKSCTKDPECNWDRSIDMCVEATVSAPITDGSTESPTLSSMKRQMEPQPTRGCGLIFRKKSCGKDPECVWDVSLNSCVNTNLTPGKGKQVVSVRGDDDCAEKKYHPTSVRIRRCSNSDSFPSVWASSPDMRKKYFFTVGDDCCATFYSDGPCEVVNVCSSTT